MGLRKRKIRATFRDQFIFLSGCCNAKISNYNECSYCSKYSKMVKKPKYRKISNGVYREVYYPLKTRKLLKEKKWPTIKI